MNFIWMSLSQEEKSQIEVNAMNFSEASENQEITDCRGFPARGFERREDWPLLQGRWFDDTNELYKGQNFNKLRDFTFTLF